MKHFDWAIIGSGIAGIVNAEILTREGHNTVLIEKNDTLASETTRDFHEWIHMGSLYTLIPDNLTTLKFILGSIDDIIEFYYSYENMNLVTTEHGLVIENKEKGWFQDNKIHFKFRVNGRKITFPWMIGAARAIFLIEKVRQHDWLRRRAGEVDPLKLKYREIFSIIKKLYRHKEKFFDIETPDFTTASRNLLRDLITTSINNGLTISLSNEFINYEKDGDGYIVHCSKESFRVKQIVLCLGSNMSSVIESEVKTSYAPLAVLKNIDEKTNSFVELDYYPKNCINIIKKDPTIGLVGGISFSDQKKCEDYINVVIQKHKKYNPRLEVLHKYNGIKNEIIIKNEPRNYLYHILQIKENVWGIIPGKFTLGFSIAPEFYRRVYKKNPRKHFKTYSDTGKYSDLVSNHIWEDVAEKETVKR